MTQYDVRVQALKEATETVRILDLGTEELVVIAEWLATGRTEAAFTLNEKTAERYREAHPAAALLSLDGMPTEVREAVEQRYPDAARWAPGE